MFRHCLKQLSVCMSLALCGMPVPVLIGAGSVLAPLHQANADNNREGSKLLSEFKKGAIAIRSAGRRDMMTIANDFRAFAGSRSSPPTCEALQARAVEDARRIVRVREATKVKIDDLAARKIRRMNQVRAGTRWVGLVNSDKAKRKADINGDSRVARDNLERVLAQRGCLIPALPR